MTDSTVFARPPRQRLCQFEVPPRGGVELQNLPRRLPPRGAQKWQAAFLRQVQVVDQRTHRRDLGPGEASESVQRSDGKQPRDARLGGSAVETRRRKPRDRRADLFHRADALGRHAIRDQHLARGEAGQFRAKPHGRAGQDVEIARGNIAPGQRPLAPDLGECGQVVVASCLEQRILGQRAGGVTSRTTSRRTTALDPPRFFASAGSSICSQIATRNPLRIRVKR